MEKVGGEDGGEEGKREGGTRRGKDRKRENCNLYIKASIEHSLVSAILPKREEEIQIGERINVYSPRRRLGVRPLHATTCAKCLANPGRRVSPLSIVL